MDESISRRSEPGPLARRLVRRRRRRVGRLSSGHVSRKAHGTRPAPLTDELMSFQSENERPPSARKWSARSMSSRAGRDGAVSPDGCTGAGIWGPPVRGSAGPQRSRAGVLRSRLDRGGRARPRDPLGHEDVVGMSRVTVSPPARGRAQHRPRHGRRRDPGARLRLLGKARTPAIPVYRGPEDELPAEELRLQHRALDLRRRELQENLLLRHRLVLETRNYLTGSASSRSRRRS
jgi:hypothetical protein